MENGRSMKTTKRSLDLGKYKLFSLKDPNENISNKIIKIGSLTDSLRWPVLPLTGSMLGPKSKLSAVFHTDDILQEYTVLSSVFTSIIITLAISQVTVTKNQFKEENIILDGTRKNKMYNNPTYCTRQGCIPKVVIK